MDIDYAHLYILTLYPGTPIYEKFRSEGRLLEDKDGSHYGWTRAMFRPKHMTPEELEGGIGKMHDSLRRHFAGKLPRAILKHLPLMIRNPRMLFSAIKGT